jgi:predicted metal-dependent peptidase
MTTPALRPDFDSKDPQVKFDRAVNQIICNHPFFAAILLRLKRVQGYVVHTPEGDLVGTGPCPCPKNVVWPQCPHSMATDGIHLYWNPRFVAHLTSGQTQGVICHEVIHVAALHPLRRDFRKPRPWNYACDQAVNYIIESTKGLVLPSGVVPGIGGKSAEELYVELPENAGGNGLTSVGYAPGIQRKQTPFGIPRSPDGTDYMIGDVIDQRNPDGSELSPAERTEAIGKTRIIVQQAINAAKAAGKVPAAIARMLDDTMEPRVPWKELLSRFIDSHHRYDYSWIRPNRRYIGGGLMFPSLWSPGFGRVALAPDASGSIQGDILKEVCSELISCLDTYVERGQPSEVDVLWFDADVYPQLVTDPEELFPRGGGGTRYSPVMNWMLTEGADNRALIVITDGICDDFGQQPECPVLWILTRPNSSFNPPFGEIACVINT